jgi:L-methionine (R)-S-oxide reductase
LDKNLKFQTLLKQVDSILEGESNLYANLANTCALIKETFNHFWIGFYLVDDKENNLVLGPFQGPVACTRIPFGKGVCGTSWSKKKTLVVKNVHEFPGHIACSSLSESEIVIPLLKDGEVVAVLDIDSDKLATFDEVDKEYFEKLTAIISKKF